MADFILYNGSVYTQDGANPWAEALVIEKDQVALVGSTASAFALRKPNSVIIDLHGAYVFPGFTDSHVHLRRAGQIRDMVDLREAHTIDDIVAQVEAKAKALPSGSWVLGFGWHQERLSDRKLPSHHRISQVAPDHPVWLEHHDGHTALANDCAMRLLKAPGAIGLFSPQQILLDDEGNLTGVFKDQAKELFDQQLIFPVQDVRRWLLTAQELCLSAGITQVHDAGSFSNPETDLEAYLSLVNDEMLSLRVYFMARSNWFMKADLKPIHQGPLSMRSVKVFTDGSLGSRSAKLFEGYSDSPGENGELLISRDDLTQIFQRATSAGFQVAVHAIGDAANRMVLDTWEAFVGYHPGSDLRCRIEHAQVLSPDDIPRLAHLSIIASMQPVHAKEDSDFAVSRLGHERMRGAYAWRSLLDQGTHIAFGSDYPYATQSIDPLVGLSAATSRVDRQGVPWFAEEQLTMAEAIRLFTLGGSFAAFQESRRGALKPEAWADLTIIDTNLLSAGPDQLHRASVLMTFVAGKLLYQA